MIYSDQQLPAPRDLGDMSLRDLIALVDDVDSYRASVWAHIQHKAKT